MDTLPHMANPSDVRRITLTEATQLLANLPDTFVREEMFVQLKNLQANIDNGIYTILLYDGDVTLTTWKTHAPIVIVHGNLTVAGILDDCIDVDQPPAFSRDDPAYYSFKYFVDDDHCKLMIVLGNVTARYLFTFSPLCITGNLTLEEALVADSTNRHWLSVGGRVWAQLIVARYHALNIGDTVEARYVYAPDARRRISARAHVLKDFDFVDAVLTDGMVNISQVLYQLAAGHVILKTYAYD
jgi:hypothetical protein